MGVQSNGSVRAGQWNSEVWGVGHRLIEKKVFREDGENFRPFSWYHYREL